jgi:sugar lactone lactonase YvrE
MTTPPRAAAAAGLRARLTAFATVVLLSIVSVADAAIGDIILIDNGGTVFSIDPTTGVRTTLGLPNYMASANGIAIDSNGDIIIANSSNPTGIVKVDATTGSQTLLSVNGDGNGTDFGGMHDVAIGPDGTIYTVNASDDAVWQVNATTGARSLLSGAGAGSGSAFGNLIGVAVDSSGDIWVADQLGDGELWKVDASTGARTSIAVGDDDTWWDVYVASDGDLLVADLGTNEILRFDPSTGAQTTLSSDSVGSGTGFDQPGSIVEEADGNFLVADYGLDAIIRVDSATGNRTILSDASNGSGVALANPQTLTLAADGTIIVGDPGAGFVMYVDPTTGNRTNAFGVASSLWSAAVSDAGDVYVTDWGYGGVIQINTATGNRTLISGADSLGATAGSGPAWVNRLESPWKQTGTSSSLTGGSTRSFASTHPPERVRSYLRQATG